MAYLGPACNIINAHVQCYLRPVPLGSPVLLNLAGDNEEHLGDSGHNFSKNRYFFFLIFW